MYRSDRTNNIYKENIRTSNNKFIKINVVRKKQRKVIKYKYDENLILAFNVQNVTSSGIEGWYTI